MKTCLLLLVCTLSLTLSAKDLPNIILMMGDDHGWEETGYNGHPHVKTPVLDEMAASGVKFERFYAAHSSCSPTRASFLTGRHPNRMGTFAPGFSFRPEETTIAQLLGKAGYHCAHLGKWHVGAVKKESPVSPLAMGFHECLSHDNFFEMNPSLSRNGAAPEVFEGESSAILIQESIAALDRAKAAGKPCLQIIWFGSPHEPYSGLPEDLALYDDLPAKYTRKVKLTSNETGGQTQRPQGEVLRERYAEITAMDRAIGTLRKHLSTTGQRENTLLFYCGDNGTSPDGALGLPHRGVKGTFYEGGTLVPGLVEWPARISEPIRTSIRACTSDLLPTIAAIAGVTLPDRLLDGVNLMPLVAHEEPRPSALHFWGFNTGGLDKANREPYIDPQLQTGTTPLVKKSGGKATRDFSNFRHSTISDSDYLGPRSIISGNHKLIIHDNKKGESMIELFDLAADPAETTNLTERQPELSAKLQTELRAWQESVLKSLTGADY